MTPFYKMSAVFIGGVVLTFLLMVLLLPSRSTVSVTLDVSAAPGLIYTYTHQTRNWQKWHPMLEEGDFKLSFSGSDKNEDAILSWRSPSIGDGFIKITSARPNEEVHYEYKRSGQETGIGVIVLKSLSDKTEVTWSDTVFANGNPWLKYRNLIAKPKRQAALDLAIHRLRKKCEAKNPKIDHLPATQ